MNWLEKPTIAAIHMAVNECVGMCVCVCVRALGILQSLEIGWAGRSTGLMRSQGTGQYCTSTDSLSHPLCTGRSLVSQQSSVFESCQRKDKTSYFMNSTHHSRGYCDWRYRPTVLGFLHYFFFLHKPILIL